MRTYLVPSAGRSRNSLQGATAARQHNGPRQNKHNIATALILQVILQSSKIRAGAGRGAR